MSVRAAALLLVSGCATRVSVAARPPAPALTRIGYSIQVGAFADPENATRLIASLGQRGIEAFYFVGSDGLRRVRFGSFDSQDLAVRDAEQFRQERLIDEYYVVAPEPEAAEHDEAVVRGQIARSAMSFLGQPYRWGGSSRETGFDCSSLAMTAYRLSGFALPRTSAAQYAVGEPVPKEELKEADLVFFATERGQKPTHVGVYLGEGRFIHAPGRGNVVRIDDLTGGYYLRHFLGARAYLGQVGGTAAGQALVPE